MSAAVSSAPLPNWLFRSYQAALVVIVAVYALILVVVISNGQFITTGEAIRLFGFLFFIYLAPGTFMLAYAVSLVSRGERPGPVMAKASLFAAFWTIVAGYNVVLT